ncbi:MAG: hypothetical protein GF331_26910 [Chitinivibrionales bacterium]|nr:hypothetical protein [Chitinivibrionales bacterium]
MPSRLMPMATNAAANQGAAAERDCPRVVLMGASASTGNLGVNALLSGTVAGLLATWPDALITLLDYGKTSRTDTCWVGERQVIVKVVNIRFSKFVWLKNNIARLLLTAAACRLLPRRAAAGVVEAHPALSVVARADVVCAIAGGDSFSDIYGLPRLFYVGLPQLLPIVLRKPLILLPQTIGPFKTWIGRRFAQATVRRCARAYARDAQGVATLRRMLPGREDRCRFGYDVAFAMQPAPLDAVQAVIPRRRRGERLIGMNVSGLLMRGGYTGRNMFGLKVDYAQLVLAVAGALLDEPGTRLLLVSHVVGDHNPESDYGACQAVLARLTAQQAERTSVAPAVLDQHQVKRLIGECEFFVGSRMHACIAALSQGVPAVGISYSPKFRGLLESVGVADLVADPTALSQSHIVSMILDRFSSRRTYARMLRERMPDVRREVLGMFGDISAEVPGRAREGLPA